MCVWNTKKLLRNQTILNFCVEHDEKLKRNLNVALTSMVIAL